MSRTNRLLFATTAPIEASTTEASPIEAQFSTSSRALTGGTTRPTCYAPTSQREEQSSVRWTGLATVDIKNKQVTARKEPEICSSSH